jgi:hypothetical protein
MHGFRNSHLWQNSTAGGRKKYPLMVSLKREA